VRIEFVDGLLFAPVTISFRGKTIIVPNLVVDTGASQSLITMDAVEELDVSPELEDEYVFMRGIGGREPSLRKRIDFIQFDSYQLTDVYLDFGYLYGHAGINGLIGLDILESGRFVIDLDLMELHSRLHK